MFLGFCLYITAMVADIRIRVMALDSIQSGQMTAADRIRVRTVYVREAQFHMDILEYVPQIGVRAWTIRTALFPFQSGP